MLYVHNHTRTPLAVYNGRMAEKDVRVRPLDSHGTTILSPGFIIMDPRAPATTKVQIGDEVGISLPLGPRDDLWVHIGRDGHAHVTDTPRPLPLLVRNSTSNPVTLPTGSDNTFAVVLPGQTQEVPWFPEVTLPEGSSIQLPSNAYRVHRDPDGTFIILDAVMDGWTVVNNSAVKVLVDKTHVLPAQSSTIVETKPREIVPATAKDVSLRVVTDAKARVVVVSQGGSVVVNTSATVPVTVNGHRVAPGSRRYFSETGHNLQVEPRDAVETRADFGSQPHVLFVDTKRSSPGFGIEGLVSAAAAAPGPASAQAPVFCPPCQQASNPGGPSSVRGVKSGMLVSVGGTQGRRLVAPDPALIQEAQAAQTTVAQNALRDGLITAAVIVVVAVAGSLGGWKLMRDREAK